MTPRSDLDITVLLGGDPAPFRESVMVAGRPVELFVHTEQSLDSFCADERRRRRPTLLRLIGSSIVVADTDGVGQRLQAEYNRLDKQGPPALTTTELDDARYLVTGLLDDLTEGPEGLAVAAALWRDTADLLLGVHRRWSGSGKWLVRELRALDAVDGTHHAEALLSGLAAAGQGNITVMQEAVTAALAVAGGPLFDGYSRGDKGR